MTPLFRGIEREGRRPQYIDKVVYRPPHTDAGLRPPASRRSPRRRTTRPSGPATPVPEEPAQRGVAETVHRLALSLDGKPLATGDKRGHIVLRNATTGRAG